MDAKQRLLRENLSSAARFVQENGLIYTVSCIQSNDLDIDDPVGPIAPGDEMEQFTDPEFTHAIGLYLDPDEACEATENNIYELDPKEYPFCVVEGMTIGVSNEVIVRIWFQWSDSQAAYECIEESEVPSVIKDVKDIFGEKVTNYWSDGARISV
jgi:hypothetical protein